MATASKTFRLFVSSTFSDLKAERNALQEYVFPRLQELCASHGTRFQAIDLRWGVSIEAGLDQRTMGLCLQELERCQNTTPKPNFLVLLGDRYGWEPLPEEIPQKEFTEILRKVQEEPQTFNSLADPAGMDALSLLDKWYCCDENNEWPLFVLQPRTGQHEVFEVWQQTAEEPLQSILRTAMRYYPLDDGRSRYQFSATHQEIHHGALKVRDAPHHVFACYRTLTNLTLGDGDVVPKDMCDFVDGPRDDTGTKRFDGAAHKRCEDLKDELEKAIGEANVHKHKAALTADGVTTSHIGELPDKWEDCLAWLDAPLPKEAPLCRQIWHDVGRVIRDECQLLEQRDPLQLETEAHARFREERARIFVGRDELLDEVMSYLDADDVRHPLVFHGSSGSGKSAFMATVAAKVARTRGLSDIDYCPVYASRIERPAGTPIEDRWTGDCILIERFIGTTPRSTNIRALLEDLCHTLHVAYRAGPFEPPEKFDALVEELQEGLKLACVERPLVVLLDAVNQLSDEENARLLNWLPTELPPHVKVIVSTIADDAPCLEAARKRWATSQLREIKPLSREQGSKILEALLVDAGRKLTDEQSEEVLRKFAVTGLPLYLKLAFEEARRWRCWEGIPSYEGRTGLAPDVPGIIRNLFWRLSQSKEHGPLLVSRSLGFLAAARHGLTEDEMLGALTLDEEFVRQFTEHPFHPLEGTVPVAVWSRLYHDLAPYLTWRFADGTELLGFYHTQVQEVAREKFLGGTDRKERHGVLATYFRRHTWLEGLAQIRPLVRRSLAEYPWHLIWHGGRWEQLVETLSDLRFLEAKARSGATYELQADFTLALKRHPGTAADTLAQGESRRLLSDFGQAVVAFCRGEAKSIPNLSSSLSLESASEATRLVESTATSGGQKERLVEYGRFVQSQARLLKVCGHYPGFVIQQACNNPVSFDMVGRGRRVLSAEKGVSALLRLHAEPKANEEPARETLKISVDIGTPHAVSITPDARLAAASHTLSAGGSLRLWDMERCDCRSQFERNAGAVVAVRLTPDGRYMVTSSLGGEILVWDLASGCVRTNLLGAPGPARTVDISPDGRWVVAGGRMKQLLVWDTEAPANPIVVQAPSAVSSVRMAADGKTVVGGLARPSNTIGVWHVSGDTPPTFLEPAHDGAVLGVDVTPDGRRAVSVSMDRTLRVWDVASGKGTGLSTVLPHAHRWVAISADGRMAVSASGGFSRLPGDPELLDHDIWVWDLDRATCIDALKGHKNWVTGLSLSPDGQFVVSSSRDDTIRMWQGPFGRRRAENPAGHRQEHLESLKRVPNSDLVVATMESGRERTFDLATGVEGNRPISWAPGAKCMTADRSRVLSLEGGAIAVRTLAGARHAILRPTGEPFDGLALSPDGRLVVAGAGEEVELWDLASNKRILSLCRRRMHRFVQRSSNGTETKSVHSESILFAPDGARVLVQDDRYGIRVFEIPRGNLLHSFECATGPFAVSPDGQSLVTAGPGCAGRWNLLSGEFTPAPDRALAYAGFIYRGHGAQGIEFTADGGYLVSAGDMSVDLWDARTLRRIGVLQQEDMVMGLSAPAASGRLAFGTQSGEVELCDLLVPLPGVPYALPVREWQFGSPSDRGQWAEDITATCPWCNARIVVPMEQRHTLTEVVGAAGLKGPNWHRIHRADDAWYVPRLIRNCPSCQRTIRYAPFIADNIRRLPLPLC